MSHLRLSICIATRNRGAFIGETLESIITQATDEVEIVIVDGASRDNTSEVVENFQTQFPRLNYVRLAQNGGVDRDYSRTIEHAQGDYCWFMTDDDLLKPRAIRRVLDETTRGYELILVNAENRTVNQSRVILDQRLKLNADRVYHPSQMQTLFQDAVSLMSYIGCVVVRRELWNARDKATYFGTWFVHIGVIFQLPLHGDALTIAEPLISGRIGNISWSDKSFEIWMFRWPQIVWSFPQFSDETKAKVVAQEPWRNLKALIIHRGDGSYSSAMFRKWIAPHPGAGSFKLAANMIARLPRCVVWLVVLIYFSLVRSARKTDRYHWLHVPVAQECFGWLIPVLEKRFGMQLSA